MQSKHEGLQTLLQQAQVANEAQIVEAVAQSESRMVAQLEQFESRMVSQLEQLLLQLQEFIVGFSKNQGRDSEAGVSSNIGKQPYKLENKSNQLTGNNLVPRYTKLDFPTFDGSEDPLTWLHRCEKFFSNQRTNEDDKVWPPLGSNSLGNLVNLKQKGSVEEYQHQFQELLAMASKLVHAMNLARAFEKKQKVIRVTSSRKKNWQGTKGYLNIVATSTVASPKSSNTLSGISELKFVSSSAPFTKKLTKVEMAKRRAKGLCYNCDELYSIGHQCKKLFLLEVVDPDDENPDQKDMQEPEISLHPITGQKSAKTMQLRALMKGQALLSLVDLGNTHNFISCTAAQRLGMQVPPVPMFQLLMKKTTGHLNKVVDALSRRLTTEELVYAISHPPVLLLDKIRQGVSNNASLKELVQQVLHHERDASWSIKDDLLLYKSRIYLLPSSYLISTILSGYHDNSHEGVQKTLHRIRQNFYSKGMKSVIEDYVVACPVYQRNKAEHLSPARLLQPLALPEQVWADIGMILEWTLLMAYQRHGAKQYCLW
ncbi:hypothetical protein T459_06193 [Capsicum annuum]|uniref:Integrase zinc-binding domain-containing protein n=1 Tax=Capsicum annuum TaxID=4072 RepID=A0A2G3AA45_CAPAN|nr:hypothetical protein T459_06193 [Capsicum annuum]